MIHYLDIVLRKVGLVRIELANSIARTKDDLMDKQIQDTLTYHTTEIANLNARIVELKRCNAVNAVGMYG